MKNPHAQALGSLGGKKAAKNMTKEQRSERARKAVEARKAKERARKEEWSYDEAVDNQLQDSL